MLTNKQLCTTEINMRNISLFFYNIVPTGFVEIVDCAFPTKASNLPKAKCEGRGVDCYVNVRVTPWINGVIRLINSRTELSGRVGLGIRYWSRSCPDQSRTLIWLAQGLQWSIGTWWSMFFFFLFFFAWKTKRNEVKRGKFTVAIKWLWFLT